jgi:hypothetical protein
VKSIWKYPLQVLDRQFVAMPRGAQVLTVQTQRGQPHIWALADPAEREYVDRCLRIYGTGHEMPADPGRYVGTFQLADGGLIYHVFEPIS